MAKNDGTKVKSCTCPDPYQDEKYGKGMRLHNGTDTSKRPGWRCTKCGKERK